MPSETLTPEERDYVEDLPGRQPGCPDKTCGVCRDNQRRGDALAKLLRIHDAHAAQIAELEADQERYSHGKLAARCEAAESALTVEQRAHAETRANLTASEDTLGAWKRSYERLREENSCTPAERKVLNACAQISICDDDPDVDPLEPQECGEDCYIYTDDQYAVAKAVLAWRGEKP